MGMQVIYSIDELSEIVFAHRFREIALFNDDMVQLMAFHILSYNVDFLFGFMQFKELNDIGMIQFLEDGQLSLDSSQILFFCDLRFLQNLDGDFLPCWSVSGYVNFAKGAFTDGLAYLEISDFLSHRFCLKIITNISYFDIQQYQMNTIILIVLNILLVASKRMMVELKPRGRWDFHDILKTNQKYHCSILPNGENDVSLRIQYLNDEREWVEAFSKSDRHSINANKISVSDSIHIFQIKNQGDVAVEITLFYSTGLEMMEFEMLPNKSDSQNLDRQLNWLEQQKKKLEEASQNRKLLNTSVTFVRQSMEKKLIFLVIIGLFAIMGVNFFFYKQLKKIFKDRKLI